MVDGLQWIGATVGVLALVLLLAHGMRRVLERTRTQSGSIHQIGSWRVAPDASVRAVRVLGRVHLLYERGRETVVLESVPAEEAQILESTRRAESPLDLLRVRRPNPDSKAQVAKG